ncbi:DUF2721 domain-containing protein, partial [Escherichia coli]|nr:DUF2721 domain-containing protein [Escherichia coli]
LNYALLQIHQAERLRLTENFDLNSLSTMFSGDLVTVRPENLNSTIEFLTAMITPALLISATGSLVLSTSTRLGRVVDRVRELERRL